MTKKYCRCWAILQCDLFEQSLSHYISMTLEKIDQGEKNLTEFLNGHVDVQRIGNSQTDTTCGWQLHSEIYSN